MECYTYLRNVTDLLSDGKTPYEKRFWVLRTHDSIWFIGWVLPCNCEGSVPNPSIWKESFVVVLIADFEELETMDASEIYSERLNAKEVIFPQKGEFTFPIADGRIKHFGGDQELRTSTLVRHRPVQGESHVDFVGESEGSLQPPHGSFLNVEENDFWSLSGNFTTQSQILFVERRIIPIFTEAHGCFRSHEFGCQARTPHRCFFWNIDGSRDLFGSWTGSTQLTLLKEKLSDGDMWSWERLSREQLNIKARLFMARTLHEIWKKWQAEGEAKVVAWKTSFRWCKIARKLFLCPWGQGIQRDHHECWQEIGNNSGSLDALQDKQ